MRVRSTALLAPRAFGCAVFRSGRAARIAIAFWPGVLTALGSLGIGLGAALVVTLIGIVAGILGLGSIPSTEPGHLVTGSAELAFYLAGGGFAWAILRRLRPGALRSLRRSDGRAVAAGLGALLVIRVATAAGLMFTGQAHHVQSGFENFNVVSAVPAVTLIASVLAALAMVVAGPVAEEIVFRGLVFGALARPLGVFGSALLSAALFAGVHGDPVLFPTLAGVGFVAALSYAATGNLGVPIVLHAANNVLGAFVLIAGSFA